MHLPDNQVQGTPPESAGIYLHIPFCKKACVYCNFHFSTSLNNKKELVAAMVAELQKESPYLEGRPVSTIYLGGGTPSLLDADEIKLLFETIHENYTVNELTECTLEANPDDLSQDYLKQLRSTEINRLSIGVQSFIENDLLYMGRAHTATQSEYAIKAAQDAGFTNLSIDLIYGTPGLTDKGWKDNLSQVADMQVPHFSAYALTVEDKTALHNAILKNKSAPVDSNQAAAQFEILMAFAAQKGYDHYEISNLSLPGKYAVHNTNYWLGKHYLGIGPSAHSFNGTSRKANISNNALYTQAVLSGKPVPAETEVLTTTQSINEYIMTSLRTMWGCNLDTVEKKWGNGYADEIAANAKKAISLGLLQNTRQVLTLTDNGKLFADKIASDLFF
jgi:oxygen-independent coproporphyrinogen-3 oxidase